MDTDSSSLTSSSSIPGPPLIITNEDENTTNESLDSLPLDTPSMMKILAPPPGIVLPQKNVQPSFNFNNPISRLDEAERYFWREYKDENDRPFYYHTKMNISTWERPKQYLTRDERLRPVSTLKLGDSDWKVVNTFGGSKYYYNFKSNETSWDFPESVSEMIKTQYENRIKENAEKKRSFKEIKEKEIIESESDEESDEEDEPEQKKQKIAEEEERQLNEEQMKSLEHFKSLSHDEKVSHFVEMLEEAGVNHETTWITIYPTICNDPRFLAFNTNNERRALVDNFVKKSINEYKKLKKKKNKEAEGRFAKLVEKAINKDNKMTWKEFKEKHEQDDIFKNLNETEAEMEFHVRKGQINADNKETHDLACKLFYEMIEEKSKSKILKDKDIKWSKIKHDLRHDERYFPDILSRKDRESMFKEYKSKVLGGN